MFLGGISLDDGSKVGMLLSTFWENYRHTHSDHVVYTIYPSRSLGFERGVCYHNLDKFCQSLIFKNGVD